MMYYRTLLFIQACTKTTHYQWRYFQKSTNVLNTEKESCFITSICRKCLITTVNLIKSSITIQKFHIYAKITHKQRCMLFNSIKRVKTPVIASRIQENIKLHHKGKHREWRFFLLNRFEFTYKLKRNNISLCAILYHIVCLNWKLAGRELVE